MTDNEATLLEIGSFLEYPAPKFCVERGGGHHNPRCKILRRSYGEMSPGLQNGGKLCTFGRGNDRRCGGVDTLKRTVNAAGSSLLQSNNSCFSVPSQWAGLSVSAPTRWFECRLEASPGSFRSVTPDARLPAALSHGSADAF